jgi:hypothetical protein
MADGLSRVRVRGREGEEVEWSRKAARRAGRLKSWLEDLDPSEETVFPIVETATTVLSMLGAMCEDDWSASCLDGLSLAQLAALVEGASNLLAEEALEHSQTVFACRLDGKRACELRELLGAQDDFDSDEERAAALAEPAFTPESPVPNPTAAGPPALQPQPSFGGLPVNDDAVEAALGKVGVGTLIELKGVNRAWRALARRILCSRLCGRKGHADPRQLDEITELHLELLIEAGRPWEAARAGRLLLHLERLTGYGFVVDVAAIRDVDLEEEDEEDEEDEENEEDEEDNEGLHLLSHAAKRALCSCVTGEGEPPLTLLLGAIACAGSGAMHGIPLEQMRANMLVDLDLDHIEQLTYQIGPEGAMLVAIVIPIMDALTRVNVRHNNIEGDSAAQLSAAVLGNLKIEIFNEIPIKEMRADSFTELCLKGKGVGVEGGMVVAGLVPVMGALTALNLSSNRLEDEGVSAVCKAIQSNKETKLASLNFERNRIGPVGANAVAAMVAVTGALTEVCETCQPTAS